MCPDKSKNTPAVKADAGHGSAGTGRDAANAVSGATYTARGVAGAGLDAANAVSGTADAARCVAGADCCATDADRGTTDVSRDAADAECGAAGASRGAADIKCGSADTGRGTTYVDRGAAAAGHGAADMNSAAADSLMVFNLDVARPEAPDAPSDEIAKEQFEGCSFCDRSNKFDFTDDKLIHDSSVSSVDADSKEIRTDELLSEIFGQDDSMLDEDLLKRSQKRKNCQ